MVRREGFLEVKLKKEERKCEQWQKAGGALKYCFNRNECLLEVAHKTKDLFVVAKEQDPPTGVCCFLFSQLYNVYESVSILCQRGFPQQGYILVRSLQEGFVNISYILAERDRMTSRAEAWIAYDFIERRNMMNDIEQDKQFSPKIKENWLRKKNDLLRDHSAFEQMGKLWPRSFQDRCRKAEVSEEYPWYRHFSAKAHLSPRSTVGQVELDGRTWKYRIGPSKNEREICRVLVASYRYFLLILICVSRYFGITPDQRLSWHEKHCPDPPKSFKLST